MNTTHISQKAIVLAMGIFLQNVHSAGRIDFLEGNVSVTSASGQLRIPKKGERFEAGEAIATGRDGEMHVHMDDNGLIAMRANTFLRIEAYKADGGLDDVAAFRLLRGSFRSITGWIGKNNPQKYAVQTSTATIGIRGTDHETLVIGDGDGAGTYDKVNSGETEMVTPVGKVTIFPGQSAYTPKAGSQPPALLAVIPAFFVVTKNEQIIEDNKKVLEDSREQRLQDKQKDNVRKGTDSNGRPKIGDPEDGSKALKAFEEFLRAFEVGNIALLRQKLDPSMIGYQQLLDNIIQENNECKQMRVTLLNTKVQAGPDLAVLQTSWEKRCLLLPNFSPKLVTGRSTVLLHLGQGGWTFAAITGGNMLERTNPKNTPNTPTSPTSPTSPNTPTSPTSPNTPNTPNSNNSISLTNAANVTVAVKTLATLSVVNGGATYAGAAILSGQNALPFTITVTDPDRVGAASVNVVLTSPAPASDALVLTLPAVTPGSSQFRVTTVNFSKAGGSLACGTAMPSNPTSLEICPSTNVTVSFTDTTTPSGSSQVVTQTVSVP